MTDLLASIDKLEDRFRSREGEVHAYLPEADRFDRLRAEAKTLSERYPNPHQRPALFGLLVGVKDIFHVDGFPTRAGSRVPPEVLAGPESDSARILKENGALIVGKTVTTEFAYFGPGPTRNPHNLAHTPGGSSSGSAAAAAAGLADLALGTQTIGSVNRPAAFCGVFGFKPSYDRISKAGVIPLAGSLDHVGAFSAKLPTLARAAAVLCRGWQTSRSAAGRNLAVPDRAYLDHLDSEGAAHFETVRAGLADRGWKIHSADFLTDFDEIFARHQLILAYEAAQVHAAYRSYHEGYHEKTLALIERGRAIDAPEYQAAVQAMDAFRKSARRRMKSDGIDAWLTPSAPGPAPEGLESTGDPIMNLPWTQAGLPAITLPTGTAVNGLPLGTQLVGRWYQEEKLFKLGEEIWKGYS